MYESTLGRYFWNAWKTSKVTLVKATRLAINIKSVEKLLYILSLTHTNTRIYEPSRISAKEVKWDSVRGWCKKAQSQTSHWMELSYRNIEFGFYKHSCNKRTGLGKREMYREQYNKRNARKKKSLTPFEYLYVIRGHYHQSRYSQSRCSISLTWLTSMTMTWKNIWKIETNLAGIARRNQRG